MAISTPVAAQDLLARVDGDNLLYVPFEGAPAVGPVFAEINGVLQTIPVRIVGSSYVVMVPPDLPGTRHDLRLVLDGPHDRIDLGWWLFETKSDENLIFGSVLSAIGARSTDGKTEGFAEGVVRLEFNRGNGQQSGRLVLSRSGDSGTLGEDEISIDDFFLETRFPIFGQDGYARIGNADVGADTILQDTVSRRGLTFGLESANGTRTVSAFVLSTETELKFDNVFGLSERDNRVSGVSGSFQFARLNMLQFNIAALEGRTTSLPDGTTGDVYGAAITVAMPFANGRGDLSFGLALSDWLTDGTTTAKEAMARDVRAAWQVSNENAYQQIELSLSYQQIDQDFFSPLNANLIPGEERVIAKIQSISPAWQWSLAYDVAETNFNGSSSAPTDELSSVSLSVLHDPGDFTGGALNGTTFYLNAGIDRQERIDTPTGAAAAQDNQFKRLSFGINKVQPKTFWGLQVAYDDLDFDAGTAQDEKKLFAEARLDLSPTPQLSAQASARSGIRESGGVRFTEGEASLALIYKSMDGWWQTALSGGYLVSTDPSVDDGRNATFSVARSVGENSQLITEVSWGSGRYAPAGTPNEGTTFGVFLRTDFGFSRN